MADNKKNVSRPERLLHTDNSLVDQPPGTTRMVLNGVNETEEGDRKFIANEESNEICYSLPVGFTPIGSVYLNKGRTVIFSVSANDSVSEIGIADDDCNYVTHVNDESSPLDQKLNFKVANQIDATYRLRQGCEDTVYFVDGNNNKPRYFNFASPGDFQDNNGLWDSAKFDLNRSYEDIPIFSSVEVLDSGGQTEPGSYNVAIQYLDEDLNPTEWISSTPTIKIYNDLSIEEYREIRGSINSDSDFLNFPTTSKAIQVNLSNLDQDFLYYRLAFIEATSGSGIVNNVRFTDVIPTTKDFFIYTGTNFASEGTEEEILQFSNIIYRAGSIEQIENRLILGNVQGKQVNFCNLQQYASRIKADCITKSVILSDITDPSNPKNPTHDFGGKGYMPGEIYSFGIVYIFDDGSISPTYHIPGKSPDVDPSTVYSPGDNVFPMATENQGVSVYTDNDNCNNSDYWGRDSEGNTLISKAIRHHRFPLRSDIGKPLVTDSIGDEQTALFYHLELRIQGDLITPTEASPDSVEFEVRVNYKVDGQDFFFSEVIDPAFYADESGTFVLDLYEYSQFHSSNNFTDIVIEMTDVNGNISDPATEWSNYFSTAYVPGTSITTDTREFSSTNQGRVVSTEILGIQFSGIDLPSLDDTNGEQIIGYYIVRNERTEFDKTILDSGVLVPSVVNSKYISHGLLQPEGATLDPSVYGLIHPEHKFNDREYFIYDEIIQQGNYSVVDRKYGKVNYDDVFDGSSYNSDKQKGGNDDGHGADGSPTSRGFDGWSFNIISRDNIVSYDQRTNFRFDNTEVKEKFYLDALGTRSINDNANDVYNICTDNKVGMIQLEDGVTIPNNNNLPYVLLKRQNIDAYSNFRVLPYYKDSVNPFFFPTVGSTTDTAVVFGGDTYVTPMRYNNSMFWDNRVAKRAGRTSFLKIVLGAVLAVIGAVLTFFTAGASTVLIGAGIALIGAGALVANAGIKQANFNRAYNDEYDKGLRQTVLDDWVDAFYNYRDNAYTQAFGFTGNGQNGRTGPSDDTIQWVGDCITDLWFETSVNTSLRTDINSTVSPFLDSPGRIESGNDTPIGTWEFFGNYYTSSNSQRYPVSSLERHLVSKLLAFDPERDDNRFYIGLALGEYYNINPDYVRGNQQKIYNHLALEYDCCSECQEDFPQRVHYSEQSFQEELSDNYRVFLPNNYRDIEGEKGEITNIYRLYDALYIHTEEALWHLPQQYQERVTNDIISFIGTGSFFEIPPKLILDDSKSSAGTMHKWGCIKTKVGILFPSQIEGKWYLFNGKELKAISDYGNSNWFKRNMKSLVAQQYYEANGRPYPYLNNPSNIYGEGFISTYDTRKERLIVTRKDFDLATQLQGVEDYEICINNEEITIFYDYEQTIADFENNGYNFIGIENCRMKFSRTEFEEVIEQREIITTISPDSIVIPFFDTTSMTPSTIANISATLDAWFPDFKNSVNGGDNNLTFQNPGTWNNWGTERWVIDPAQLVLDNVGTGLDVLLLVFVDEVNSGYHNGTLSDPMTAPKAQYQTDALNFTTIVHPQFESFKAINYPIVRNTNECREYLQHAIAAIEGVDMTLAEVNDLEQNPNFSNPEWDIVKANLQNNPYVGQPILRNFGWLYKENRIDGVDNNGSAECPIDGVSVITPCQFSLDVEELLESSTVVEEVDVAVQVPVTTIEYVEGEILPPPFTRNNNSWTMSFDLKENAWVGWHSYFPNFYFYVSEKFYGWQHGTDNIWKFNRLGHYQTYFGVYHPHIIEYVSVSNPLKTKIWDWFIFQTEAKDYSEIYEDYVDRRDITHNKIMVYNTRQNSGIVNLIPKANLENADYLSNQISNTINDIIIDREERDWHINDLRDKRVNYDLPMFIKRLDSRQDDYYIDKVINQLSMNVGKDWTQLESFRDKFLVIRFIFDNFDNIRIITNYSIESENQSPH